MIDPFLCAFLSLAVCLSKLLTSMKCEESCRFFHTSPLIHLFYSVRKKTSAWWFGYHSLLHYILYTLHWSLVPVYNDKSERWSSLLPSSSSSSSFASSLQPLLRRRRRRRKIHFLLSILFFSLHSKNGRRSINKMLIDSNVCHLISANAWLAHPYI